jgi:hypothetical protein
MQIDWLYVFYTKKVHYYIVAVVVFRCFKINFRGRLYYMSRRATRFFRNKINTSNNN